MKILWAVDIFESHPKAIKSMTQFLSALHKRKSLTVDALSIVGSTESFPSDDFKKESHQRLEAHVRGVQKENWFKSAHVLFKDSHLPQRVAVMKVIEFAQKGDYDAIVAVKHSKSGKLRAYLGSFAEMLAFLSPLPLFLVNPDGFTPKDIRKILFASDASLSCGQEFRKLSRFLPLEKVHMKLLHWIPSVFPNWTNKRDQAFYRKSETARAAECLARVEEIAEELGVQTKTTIKQTKSVPEDSILKEAKSDRCDLIVLTHKGKGAIGFFLGRITRRILQNADRPVLLFRV